MDGGEVPQTSDVPETLHRPLASSQWKEVVGDGRVIYCAAASWCNSFQSGPR
jgi:hypothetical protein